MTTPYKEKIIKYVLLINKYYKDLGVKTDYCSMKDIAEIRGKWTKDECENVWDYLSCLKNNTYYQATCFCPWCIRNSNNCKICKYGKRNGICNSNINNNNWFKLCKDPVCLNLINWPFFQIKQIKAINEEKNEIPTEL